jgi:hypothetical protein
MGRFSDEIREPWGVLVSSILGGVAWASSGNVLAGVGVGAAVLAVKVGTALVSRGQSVRMESGRQLPVDFRSTEGQWLQRAEQAVDAFDEIARSIPAGPVAERLGPFAAETHASFGSLRRLAGQAGLVRSSTARVNRDALAREHSRLLEAVNSAEGGRLRVERTRSLTSVQSQLETYHRLEEAYESLLARLESGTIGLEGLVARLTEVVALTETASSTFDDASVVDALSAELEGLRAGLVEAEGISAEALGSITMPEPGNLPKPGRSRSH